MACSAALSPKITTDLEKASRLFSVHTPFFQIKGNKRIVCLDWSVNGNYLGVGTYAGVIGIWQIDDDKTLSSGEFTHTRSSHKGGSVQSLSWNPNAQEEICAGCDDHYVVMWDLRRKDPVHLISTNSAITSVSYSHDGKYLAIVDRTNTISIVDGRKYEVALTGKSECSVYELKWSLDDRNILASDKDGQIQIYNISESHNRMLHKKHTLVCHNGSCYCFDISSNGQYIATGGADGFVTLWDYKSLTCIKGIKRERPGCAVTSVSFSREPNLLAVGTDSCDDNTFIDIVHASSQKSIHRISNKQMMITAVKWHPKRAILAFADTVGKDRESSYGKDESLSSVLVWNPKA